MLDECDFLDLISAFDEQGALEVLGPGSSGRTNEGGRLEFEC